MFNSHTLFASRWANLWHGECGRWCTSDGESNATPSEKQKGNIDVDRSVFFCNSCCVPCRCFREIKLRNPNAITMFSQCRYGHTDIVALPKLWSCSKSYQSSNSQCHTRPNLSVPKPKPIPRQCQMPKPMPKPKPKPIPKPWKARAKAHLYQLVYCQKPNG